MTPIQLIVTLAGFLSSAAAATGISEILAVKMNQWGIPGSRIAALVLVTIILVYVNLVFGELIPKRAKAPVTPQIRYPIITEAFTGSGPGAD